MLNPTCRRLVPLAEYDRALKVELGTLPQRLQAAFAAACAERLYRAYDAFVQTSGRDDNGLVRQALDLAWKGAEMGSVTEPDPARLVERVVALIPDVDSDDFIPDHADDAIASTAYALQAAAGLDAGAATWAAERVMSALDSFILSTDPDPTAPEAEQRVWEHPLVGEEINRRTIDLSELVNASDWIKSVEVVRSRAIGISALPLDQLMTHNPRRLT